VFAKIKAIIEGIRLVSSILKSLESMYETWQENRIHKHYEEKRKAKEKVTQQIQAEVDKPKEQQDDEILKDLHRRLTNLGG
jgi:hypothetical protein